MSVPKLSTWNNLLIPYLLDMLSRTWKKKLKNSTMHDKPMVSDTSQKLCMKSIIQYNVAAQTYVGKAAMKVWA